MNEEDESHPVAENDFTDNIEDVIRCEREYLDKRRSKYDLPPLANEPRIWGLSLSGGGIRSATFCLGVIQALTRCGMMRRFAYLSTVSGGGYIGSCLTSLLSGRWDTGLEHEQSPFTGLREHDDYAGPDGTKLSVRHQIHHLRTHGEYLVPRSRLLSRDPQRAVGSVLSGTLHMLLMFTLMFVAFVAASHLLLSVVDPNLDVLAPRDTLSVPGGDEMSSVTYVPAVLKAWWTQRVVPPFKEILGHAAHRLQALVWIAAAGIVWCIAWVVVGTWMARRFRKRDGEPTRTTRAGWTAEDEKESRFVRRFNALSVVLAAALLIGLALYWRLSGGTQHTMAALLVPLAFALGGLLATHLLTFTLETVFALLSWRPGKTSWESRFRRSLYGSLRGAALYGAVAALVLPALAVLLLSISNLPAKFFWALAALAWAYLASRRAGDVGTPRLGGWVVRPLANVAVLVFLAFAYAQVSAWLITLYRPMDPWEVWPISALVIIVVLIPFVVFGYAIDANRTSPHYFYRDRLTEAYLKTEARTLRKNHDSQGMPLTVLRDCEDLRLGDLGSGNGRGPYHLIVASLNLAGSSELNRKSFLSDHFIFSRDYIGSRVTGWVKTTTYHEGNIRLARAMTISAAAVASAMGKHTFAAQAFVMTLFNFRLGYWTENPWTYRRADTRRGRGLVFWPRYLAYEIFGLTSAKSQMVNVSDGGHTGDNLGVLPLIERRCSTIVVCDGEADDEYGFGSFNNAVRMALTEQNVTIDIDLTPVMTRTKTPAGVVTSASSVVEGRVHYPQTPSGEPAFTGTLIYIKAAVSGVGCPVHVLNYAREHEEFPHQTTADQFFDDAQFEAYRCLGEHIGTAAATLLRDNPAAKPSRRAAGRQHPGSR